MTEVMCRHLLKFWHCFVSSVYFPLTVMNYNFFLCVNRNCFALNTSGKTHQSVEWCLQADAPSRLFVVTSFNRGRILITCMCNMKSLLYLHTKNTLTSPLLSCSCTVSLLVTARSHQMSRSRYSANCGGLGWRSMTWISWYRVKFAPTSSSFGGGILGSIAIRTLARPLCPPPPLYWSMSRCRWFHQ